MNSTALELSTTENIYDINFSKRRKQFFVCADSTLLFGISSHLSVFILANTGVPIIKPTRVLELSNGLLLLYIDGKGVYEIDSTENLIPLIKETGIDGSNKGIQVSVIFYQDAKKNFWIAFPELGLFEYRFEKSIFQDWLTI